jgi:RimJ/RimL family protein N-acetyltransferase
MDDADIALAFGAYDDGALVAAATLADFAGAPRHVGVLVAPAARGRRLVDDLGACAASYAIRHHGLARWRARPDNRGSSGAAQRLGFQPWCVQLAIR